MSYNHVYSSYPFTSSAVLSLPLPPVRLPIRWVQVSSSTSTRVSFGDAVIRQLQSAPLSGRLRGSNLGVLV